MVWCLVSAGILVGQWPGFGHAYLLDLPKWASDPKSKNGDPVFLTYVGGDAGLMPEVLSPRHWSAAQGIRPFIHWQDPYDLLFPRATVIAGKSSIPQKPTSLKAVIRPSNLTHVKRIDSNGNTILNRLLMSHIVIEEKPMLQAVLSLKSRGYMSMQPNQFGQTPLMFAVESGYPSLVEEVLKLNPNIRQKDRRGNDIFEYMISSVDRPDHRYATSRVVYTSESICDTLLRHVSQTERGALIVRARLAMNYIRLRTSDTGIVP